VLADEFHEGEAILNLAAAGDDDLAARYQRQEEFQSGDIEGDRRHRDERVARAEARFIRHGEKEVRQGSM